MLRMKNENHQILQRGSEWKGWSGTKLLFCKKRRDGREERNAEHTAHFIIKERGTHAVAERTPMPMLGDHYYVIFINIKALWNINYLSAVVIFKAFNSRTLSLGRFSFRQANARLRRCVVGCLRVREFRFAHFFFACGFLFGRWKHFHLNCNLAGESRQMSTFSYILCLSLRNSMK